MTNRTGLRASFRQAYAYGVGDRRLRRKYARVIAAFAGLEPLPVATGAHSGEAAPADGGSRRGSVLTRVARKVAGIRRSSDLANLANRVGISLGARFGPVDRSAEVLAAPSDPEALLARQRAVS